MANSQDFFTSLTILDDSYAEIRQQAIEYRTPACPGVICLPANQRNRYNDGAQALGQAALVQRPNLVE